MHSDIVREAFDSVFLLQTELLQSPAAGRTSVMQHNYFSLLNLLQKQQKCPLILCSVVYSILVVLVKVHFPQT